MTLDEANRLRQRIAEHFPSTCPSVISLNEALEEAEQCRAVTLSVMFADALALRAAVSQSAPGFITDTLRFLVSQLPAIWPEERSVDVLLTTGYAKQLYAHHCASPLRRRRVSRTILRILETAEVTNDKITPAMPWDAAHIIDTVSALHRSDRLLRRLRSSQ